MGIKDAECTLSSRGVLPVCWGSDDKPSEAHAVVLNQAPPGHIRQVWKRLAKSQLGGMGGGVLGMLLSRGQRCCSASCSPQDCCLGRESHIWSWRQQCQGWEARGRVLIAVFRTASVSWVSSVPGTAWWWRHCALLSLVVSFRGLNWVLRTGEGRREQAHWAEGVVWTAPWRRWQEPLGNWRLLFIVARSWGR